MAIADKRLYAFRLNSEYSSHFVVELFEDMTDHDVKFITERQTEIETSKFARSMTLLLLPIIFVYNCVKNRRIVIKAQWDLVKEELAYIRTPTKTLLLQSYKDLNGDYDE